MSDIKAENPEGINLEREEKDKTKENIIFGMQSVKARVIEMAKDPACWQCFGNDKLDEGWKVDYLTANKCKSFSALTLDIIQRSYPDTIEQCFVISGVKTRGFKDVPKHSEHSYFVVKAKSGKFFAGSPANTV